MTVLEWLLQALLLALLGAAIPFILRLERQLAALRRDRAALEGSAAGFGEAARLAEAAVLRLRAAAEAAGKGVAEKIATAEPLAEDLRYLSERAEAIADRLDSLVRAARPLAGAEAPVPQPMPRSQAERELLQALRLAR
jgi:hypothetical protein